MRRHVIIGYFGPLDRTSVSVMDDEIVTRFDLVASKKQLGYGIGRTLNDLAQLNIFPSEMGLDFLVLAAHVHAADTRISRKTESQDTWTREIRLVVPMSDPERWIFTAPVLKRLFNFLTGDRWTIEFRPRPRSFTRLINWIAGPSHFRSVESLADIILLRNGMSDEMANQESVPYPTLDGETELFLNTAGGGRPEHTFQTHRSGRAYFKPYLEETQDRTAERPIADLNPDMFHRMAI